MVRAVAVVAALLMGVIAGAANATGDVSIRYTAFGVAHISADDFLGLGYGYGYVFARDNLCLAIDHAITLAGERSALLGPEGSYFDGFAALEGGANVANFDSDVFYRAHLGKRVIEAAKSFASPDLRALMRGFSAGFDAHVAEPALPGEECRTQPGFRALTEDDLWRRAVHIPFLETSNLVLQEIVRASPPASGGVAALRDGAARDARKKPMVAAVAPEALWAGSNAVAFGRDSTTNGRGLSFSNPHFPWDGIERLHAVHLTVPGKYDVFGAALYNFPVPMLGFNKSFAWSITYTTDQHATVYELDLDPHSATRYRYGNKYEAMKPVVIKVPVKTAQGSEIRTQTLWQTRYGFVLVLKDLPWNRVHAYAIADPELANVRMGDQFLDIGRAADVHVAKAALDRYMALPWSNLTAADAKGDVLYANISLTPDIDNAKLARCRASVNASFLPINAIAPVLRGADPGCRWTEDPAAVQPGTVPPARRPFIFRTDFVLNSNDSHWLPTGDPKAVLAGFPATIGVETTLRGERTRMGMLLAQGRRAGTDGLGAPGVDAGKWEALFFRSRNLMAELLLDDLLADCRAHPQIALANSDTVDASAACAILDRWDRTDRLEARGSTLFRAFIMELEHLPETGLKLAARYWRVPFDPADPIRTPRGLAVSPETRSAFARAIRKLNESGIPLDAPLRDVQFAERNAVKLPMSGSSYTYNMAIARFTAKGLAPVFAGDSYMHIVGFDAAGPVARFMVTYSESTNPESPHFGDLTRLFSTQSLADAPFSESQIAAAQVGPTITLRVP